MTGVQQDFRTRVAEIEAYFAFIEAVEEGHVLLVRHDTAPAYSISQRDDLLRTFKASAFLMLYNLMEATVKNTVEAIFDELKTQSVSFDSCRKEVRRVVLNNLKHCGDKDHLRTHGVDDVLDLFGNLATDAVTKTFQRESVVSGNVDAREIRGLADQYGFVRPAVKGDSLLTVKTNRNDLAHGAKSFAEVGRDFDMSRLGDIKTEVITYLSKFIASVADYLNHQHYLVAPGRP